jgi:CAAX protease family protein
LLLAVLGEELFWRAAVLRGLLARLPTLRALTIATAAYGLAHVASGMWLLPLAAVGAGLVWGALYAWTRNLTAPTVSHFVFDLFVLIVAPLA